MACDVTAGVGVDHIWRVEIRMRGSDVMEPFATTTHKIGYVPPRITSVHIDDATRTTLRTRGGDRVIIRGENFGPPS